MPYAFQADLVATRFYLHEIARLPALLTFPSYQHVREDLVDAVMVEAEKFAAQVLAPLNASGDRAGASFHDGDVHMPEGFGDAYKQFVEMGWGAATAPVEAGGQGLPYVARLCLDEMWHGANMAFALCPLLTHGAVDLLLYHGTDAQRATYLTPLTSGEWSGTMAMTEPQAGSDVGAVRTRATPAGDGTYRLSGSKIYITYGEHDMAANIVHMVLARLPDAPDGAKGLSLFLVPKFLPRADGTPGERNRVRCQSIEHKMGIHASPTCVLEFDEAEGTLIGEPHGGLAAMFTMMNAARLSVGKQGIGVAAQAARAATAYAYERVQGRRPGAPDATPVVAHPDVTRMLLSMDAEVHGLRATALYTARLLDLARAHPDAQTRALAADMADLLIPVVKAHSTNRAFDITSTAMQVFGGMGYIEESGAPQFLRDVRIAMIYEGTNGIQALDLAMRKIRSREGEAVRALILEMVEFAQGLQTQSDTALQRLGTPLLEAVRQLELATLWMLKQHKLSQDDPALLDIVQTQATLYLECFGMVMQAYLLFVAAMRAASGEWSAEWRQSCLSRAEFFCRQQLPYVATKAHIILAAAA